MILVHVVMNLCYGYYKYKTQVSVENVQFPILEKLHTYNVEVTYLLCFVLNVIFSVSIRYGIKIIFNTFCIPFNKIRLSDGVLLIFLVLTFNFYFEKGTCPHRP